MARYFFFLLLAFLAAQPLAFASGRISAASSVSDANIILSNATAYVSSINQSGYLIFAPKLGKSYSYLNMAEKDLNSSPQSSVLYSSLAVEAARQAYGKIISYRNYAFLGDLVFTIVMGLLLFRFMKPTRSIGKKRKKVI